MDSIKTKYFRNKVIKLGVCQDQIASIVHILAQTFLNETSKYDKHYELICSRYISLILRYG